MKITNRFLQGPYEPLGNEYRIDVAKVIGEIPRELKGTLYRVAPSAEFMAEFMLDDPNRFFWFDGDGMVHAFHLEDGHVSYRNRWIETEGLKVERAVGKQLYNGIYSRAGVPQAPLPEGAPKIKTTANVNLIRLGKRLLTLHEAGPHYWEIDPVTLETLGTFDFDGQVPGMLTAHPHFDVATGEWIFYSLDNEAEFVTCFTTDVEGKILTRHQVPMSFTPWNHDVTFSADYFIFCFGLISWRPYADDRIPLGKSSWFLDPKGGKDAKILFVHRKTGEATWLEPKNAEFVIIHFLNAYQEGDNVIFDATTVPLSGERETFKPEEYDRFPWVPGPAAFEKPQLWRFVINPTRGTVEHHRIGDFINAEFPRPNETIMGTRHRYGYMDGTHAPGPDTRGVNCLVKHDYETGQTQFQHLADYDLTPGEPIFVPHPQATAEDHGWVLTVWYDPHRNASDLVILDAQSFDAEPVARVRLDHHVPLGFHGNWIEDL